MNTKAARIRWVFRAAMFVCVLFLLPSENAQARPVTEISDAENYVIAQIANGAVADLNVKCPRERPGWKYADWEVSAKLIEDLLTTTNYAIHRHGVRVRNAVIRQPLDLLNADIPCDTRFLSCVFLGFVDFRKSHFHKDVSFAGSLFVTNATFYDAKIDGLLSFEGAIFGNEAYFDGAIVLGQLKFNSASFTNSTTTTAMFDMKIGGPLFFTNTVFAGSMDLHATEINKGLFADGVQCLGPTNPVNFGGINIGGHCAFVNASFPGPIDFRHAYFARDLRIIHSHFGSGSNLSRTSHKDSLVTADFSAIKVEDKASFQETAFAGEVSFSDAIFTDVDLSLASADVVTLDGMTYQRITAGSAKETNSRLLKFLERSTYRPDNYVKLSEFFRRQGQQTLSNKVYYEQKRRERQRAWEESHLLGLPKIFGSGILAITVMYGRHPELAFGWSFLCVVIGCFVFRPRFMECSTSETTVPKNKYCSLWYSLDLFIPGVDLQFANRWTIKQEYARRHYMLCHRILGWILIPIGLAALAGLFKQ